MTDLSTVIRERQDYFSDRVEFAVDGWRRWAYWTAVATLGASYGIRYGHPDLSVIPGYRVFPPVTAAEAAGLANLYVVASVVCLAAILGREGVIDDDTQEGDGQ